MNRTTIEQIADAVLYEGYNLYPYRSSSLKNRHRWTFGVIYPRDYCLAHGNVDPWMMQTECLISGGDNATLDVKVRFLHLQERTAGPSEADPNWHGTIERAVIPDATALADLASRPLRTPFGFPERPVEGHVERSLERVGDGLFKLRVRIENLTPVDDPGAWDRDQAILRAMVSTHAILGIRGGEFHSAIDPPEPFREFAEGCRNIGTWPVLVGESGARDRLLSAPIILQDNPQVAPESPGDLFDGTEIDEILTLRIRTLTDREKREMGTTDDRTRALLKRAEALDEGQLAALHGAVRAFGPIDQEGAPETVQEPSGRARPRFEVGDRVRLRPGAGADVLDLALGGQHATIECVEEDLEGRIYLGVTVDDDQGRDLNRRGSPGHRFFFRPEEVEPIVGTGDGPTWDRVLIAGIGNIFLGDDGFGVEVAQRMARREQPVGVRVVDFGIRGLDLAYAMLDGFDTVIFVDAAPRGGTPGMLYVIEPDPSDLDGGQDIEGPTVAAHDMDPVNVLRLVKALGGVLPKVLVVGCEPMSLGDEGGSIGLSAPVLSAVDEAVVLVESLVAAASAGDVGEVTSCTNLGSPRS